MARGRQEGQPNATLGESTESPDAHHPFDYNQTKGDEVGQRRNGKYVKQRQSSEPSTNLRESDSNKSYADHGSRRQRSGRMDTTLGGRGEGEYESMPDDHGHSDDVHSSESCVPSTTGSGGSRRSEGEPQCSPTGAGRHQRPKPTGSGRGRPVAKRASADRRKGAQGETRKRAQDGQTSRPRIAAWRASKPEHTNFGGVPERGVQKLRRMGEDDGWAPGGRRRLQGSTSRPYGGQASER